MVIKVGHQCLTMVINYFFDTYLRSTGWTSSKVTRSRHTPCGYVIISEHGWNKKSKPYSSYKYGIKDMVRHIVILAHNNLDYNRLLADLPSWSDMPKDGHVANYIPYLCKPSREAFHVRV